MGPALRYQQPGTGRSAWIARMINRPESRSGFVFASSRHASARLPAAALGPARCGRVCCCPTLSSVSFTSPFPSFPLLQSPCFLPVLLPPEKSPVADRPTLPRSSHPVPASHSLRCLPPYDHHLFLLPAVYRSLGSYIIFFWTTDPAARSPWAALANDSNVANRQGSESSPQIYCSAQVGNHGRTRPRLPLLPLPTWPPPRSPSRLAAPSIAAHIPSPRLLPPAVSELLRSARIWCCAPSIVPRLAANLAARRQVCSPTTSQRRDRYCWRIPPSTQLLPRLPLPPPVHRSTDHDF
jgi:hypothetical protein